MRSSSVLSVLPYALDMENEAADRFEGQRFADEQNLQGRKEEREKERKIMRRHQAASFPENLIDSSLSFSLPSDFSGLIITLS